MSCQSLKRSRFNKFTKEDDGSVAVEAAFILPVMVTLWLGLVTIIDMQNASTNVGKVTSAVADIIAQSAVINVPAIDCSFQAGDSMLNSKHGPNLEMYVVGVEVADGKSAVMWSRGKNLHFRALPEIDTPYDGLPVNLLTSDGYYVVSHARLNHVPIFGASFINDGSVQYEYKNYFVPRSSGDVICTDCELLRDTPTIPC